MEPHTTSDPAAESTNGTALPPSRARTLLRKLRDLNLNSRITVAEDLSVRLGGCLSADLPAEESLVYRVAVDERSGHGVADGELAIRWRAGWLELALSGCNGHALSRQLSTPLNEDSEGRASAPELGARLDPESAEAKDVEHFLRRLIRGLLHS